MIAVGAISSYDDVNSILLAGRADLCRRSAGRTSTTRTGRCTRRPSRTTTGRARPGRRRTGPGSRKPPTGRTDGPPPRLQLIREPDRRHPARPLAALTGQNAAHADPGRLRRGADRRPDRGRRPHRPAVGRRRRSSQLPPPFGQTATFQLEEISRYDDRGPGLVLEQHPHRRAHRHPLRRADHWVTGQDGDDVAAVPAAPADRRRPPSSTSPSEAAADPDFLLEVDHVRAWEARARRRCRPAAGCSTAPAGTPGRRLQAAFLNADETGPHTPGISPDCARWLAEEAPVHRPRRRDRRHRRRGGALASTRRSRATRSLLGSGKYGLTQLQNLALLPPTGALLVAGPLPIVGGSGSPGPGRWRSSSGEPEVAATRRRRRRARRWCAAGVDHVFGVVGSGNFHVTNAMVAAGARFVAARHEGGAATMADAYARMSAAGSPRSPCTRAAG